MSFQAHSYFKYHTGGPFSVAHNGFRFQPKAIFFQGGQSTFTDAAQAAFGFGFASSDTEQRSIYYSADDNADTSNSAIGEDATMAYEAQSPGGSIYNSIDVTSFDADGFTADVFGTSFFPYAYMGIGGDGIQAKAFTKAVAADETTISITGIGFKGNVVILMAQDPSGVNPQKSIGLGFATATQQATISIMDQDNVGTANSSRAQRTDLCLAIINTSTFRHEFSFSSFDSDGITLNGISVPENITLYGIVLSVPNAYIGSFTTPTATGIQSYTDPGFPVGALLMFSWGRGASTSVQAGANIMAGFFGGTVKGNADVPVSIGFSTWSGSEDNVGFSDCNQGYLTTVLRIIEEATQTTRHSANMSSWDATGFSLDYTTANASTSEVIYLALGGKALTRIHGGKIYGTRIQ